MSEEIICEECNEYIKESFNVCKSCLIDLAINYNKMRVYGIHITTKNEELKQENARLREALDKINSDNFVADYQSECNRMTKLAREALGVK